MDMATGTTNNHAHSIAQHSDHNIECDGSTDDSRKGSWMGHFYPGLVFIVWGTWWAYNTCAYWLWRSARRPYRGRAWYPMAVRGLWCLEPVLKMAVPLVAVSFELYFDHDAYRYLYCPEGTKFGGRFALSHMNNWQHTASYPGVALSGAADLLALAVPLPPGTSQGVLACGFASMAFIMWTHEKHEPQDKAVHWLLFVAMALSALAVSAELAARRSVLAGLAKSLALLLQGAWLVQIAHTEFGGKPQWSTEYSGGAMMAPVAFCAIAAACLAALLAFYTLLALSKQWGLLPARLTMLPLGGEEEQAYFKRGAPQHPYTDSAHATDDSEGLADDAAGPAGASMVASGRSGMVPFSIMHARAATHDSMDACV